MKLREKETTRAILISWDCLVTFTVLLGGQRATEGEKRREI